MFSRHQERKSDLRNVSVMEVIIAVILIIVVMWYFEDIKHQETKDQIPQLIKQIASLEEEANKLKKKIRSLEKKVKELEQEKEFLRKFVKSQGSKMKGFVEIKAVAENLRKENLALSEEIKTLEKTVNTLKGGRGGSDKPPCSVNDEENYKFLASIEIKNNLFHVLKDKNANRMGLANLESLKNLFKASPLNASEFKKFAKPVNAWSRENDCVFYVKIRLNNDLSVTHTMLIERYFYKSYQK